MKFTFFHTPKPRAFEYKPRFYDPAKEEWEARKRELLGEDYHPAEGEKYRPGQYIGELRIRRSITAERQKRQNRQRRTLRSIVLLLLLLAFGWWLMRTDLSHTVWATFLGGQQTQQPLSGE